MSSAELDESLEIDGSALAARMVETRLTVAVSISGHGPYRFLVDSGADRTVIGATLAGRLGLPLDGTARVNGVTGASNVAMVLLDGLKVGDSAVPPVIAPALPERFLGADGILGIDALTDQRLALDFQHHTITIQNGRSPVRSSGDEIVVTARRRHGQLIMMQVTLAGIPVAAVIDTGSQVTIGNLALLNRLSKRRRMPAPIPLDVTSVTGITATAQLYPAKPLTIGSLTLTPASIAFADFPPFSFFGLRDQPALLLGADVLGSFSKVSLDFHARKIRFQLRQPA